MSKKIEINVYEFSELSKDAQKTAINEAREWVGETQAEIDGDAFHWTKEEMEKVLGIKMDFSNHCTKWGWGDDYEDRWDDLSDDPKYLLRYINWVMGRVDTLKTYYLPFEKSRRYHPTMTERKSHIISGGFRNILTGEWTDDTFDKWMTDAYDWVRGKKTIDDFVDSLVRAFRAEWDEDVEWGYSDDNVRDILDGNGDLYFEDGRKYES